MIRINVKILKTKTKNQETLRKALWAHVKIKKQSLFKRHPEENIIWEKYFNLGLKAIPLVIKNLYKRILIPTPA